MNLDINDLEDRGSIPVEIKAVTASATGYEGTYDGKAHGIAVSIFNPTSGTKLSGTEIPLATVIWKAVRPSQTSVIALRPYITRFR